MTTRMLLALPLFLLAGCGEPPVAVDSEGAALVASNGHMQNGHMQNGSTQNGDLALAGVDLTTMVRLVNPPAAGQAPDLSPANVVQIPNVRLDKGVLTDGVHSGAYFDNTIVYGHLSDGETQVPVLIQAVTATSDPEVPHYTVQAYHRVGSAISKKCLLGLCPSAWDYVCGAVTIPVPCRYGVSCPPRIIATPALAIGGQWDYHSGNQGDGRKLIEASSPSYSTQITFACTDGAIGKCVEKAGYKPWAAARTECRVATTDGQLECYGETQELLHEACVRMVRADYCGSGQSMTVDGIGIDLWDESSINTESEQVWGKEGEWTPNGARCLDVANMGRTNATTGGFTLGAWLNLNCPHKWDGQYNQSAPFRWEDNDCFGHGPASQRSSFYTANLPGDPTFRNLSSMDMHDRVWIQNRSMCVYVDGAPDMGNPDANNPLCL